MTVQQGQRIVNTVSHLHLLLRMAKFRREERIVEEKSWILCPSSSLEVKSFRRRNGACVAWRRHSERLAPPPPPPPV